jgi:hypothetical protein
MCVCVCVFLISCSDWRSQGAVWIIHGEHANAESKIERIRCFIRNWNW